MHLTDPQYDDLNQQLAEVEMDKSLNTTQHTPGPWILDKRGHQFCEIQERNEAGYTVATAWGGGLLDQHVIANATLIAAAPDLLAALIEVLPNVPGWNNGDLAARPWLQKAKDAIKKATL